MFFGYAAVFKLILSARLSFDPKPRLSINTFPAFNLIYLSKVIRADEIRPLRGNITCAGSHLSKVLLYGRIPLRGHITYVGSHLSKVLRVDLGDHFPCGAG